MVGSVLAKSVFTLDGTDDDGNTSVMTQIDPATGEVSLLCTVGTAMRATSTGNNKF